MKVNHLSLDQQQVTSLCDTYYDIKFGINIDDLSCKVKNVVI